MTKKRKYRLRKLKKVIVIDGNKKIPIEHSTDVSSGHVVTNQGEIDMLSRYILDYPNAETGGQLFGYWTFDGNPVVLFVLGPGPNAKHYGTFFMQDLDYLKERAIVLKQRYGLDHVGEWHSHHQLGISHPSGHDAHNISTNMRKLGYTRFLLCIGTCSNAESSVNAFMFSASTTDYKHIPWLIKKIDSPFRQTITTNGGNFFIPPFAKTPNIVGLYTKDCPSGNSKVNYKESYWLTFKDNVNILKAILDNLKDINPSNEYIPTLDQSNEVHIEIYKNGNLLEDIHFHKAFPVEPPRIIDSLGQTHIEPAQWCHNGDILTSFMSYYNYLNKFKVL